MPVKRKLNKTFFFLFSFLGQESQAGLELVANLPQLPSSGIIVVNPHTWVKISKNIILKERKEGRKHPSLEDISFAILRHTAVKLNNWVKE